jgi:hypothetical protein
MDTWLYLYMDSYVEEAGLQITIYFLQDHFAGWSNSKVLVSPSQNLCGSIPHRLKV